MFNHFYEIEQQIEAERMQNIETLIMMMYRSLTNRFLRRFIVEEIVPRIIDNIDFYKKDAEKLRAFILDDKYERYSLDYLYMDHRKNLNEKLHKVIDVNP